MKSLSVEKPTLKQWRIHDFPERGANSQSGCANLLFCKLFAENCMKMKEFGSQDGRVSLVPPWIHQCFKCSPSFHAFWIYSEFNILFATYTLELNLAILTIILSLLLDVT